MIKRFWELCLCACLSLQCTLDVLHCISKPTFQVEFQLADLEEVTVTQVWQMLSEQTLCGHRTPTFRVHCVMAHTTLQTRKVWTLSLYLGYRTYWNICSMQVWALLYTHSECANWTFGISPSGLSSVNHIWLFIFMAKFTELFDHISCSIQNFYYFNLGLILGTSKVSVPSCVLLNKVRALGCDCKSAPPVSHPVFHFSLPHPVTSRATKVVW